MLKEIPQTVDISEVEDDPFMVSRVRGLTPEDLRLLPSEGLQWVDVIVTERGKSFTLKHLLDHYIGDDRQSRIYIFRPYDDGRDYSFEDVRRVRGKVIKVAGGNSPDDDGRIMLGKRNRLTPSRIADLTEKYKEHFGDVQIHEATYFDTQITPESLGLSPEKVRIEIR